jgi:hypothetical protein
MRVDPSVYPRRPKHNTVAEGGIDNEPSLTVRIRFSGSCPTAASRRITSLYLSPIRRCFGHALRGALVQPQEIATAPVALGFQDDGAFGQVDLIAR